MGSPSPPGVPSRRLPPRPESVAPAREFVRAALDGAPPDLVATALLLTSELVTNAVIHARTEIEVRAWAAAGRVHVRISDERPCRALVERRLHPYATTGWGMALVDALASTHGVQIEGGRKTAWFELWPEAPPPPPASAQVIMSRPGPAVTVTLVDLPYALYSAARQHWEALLRELLLAVYGSDPSGAPVRAEDILVAHDLSNVIGGSMAAAVDKDISEADTISVSLAIPADSARDLGTFCCVLEDADAAAQQESLLTLPALPQIRAFWQWICDEVARQVAGEHPISWTLAPGTPSTRPLDLAAWDAGDLQASPVPTIAADEEDRIIAVNEPVADLLGWRADDLVGQRVTVLIPEHLRERHMVAFTSLLLTGQPRILGHSIPLPALHRDGRLVHVRLNIQIQEAADGRTVFVAQLTPRTAAPRAPREDRYAPRPTSGDRYAPAAPEKTERVIGEETYEAALERLSLLADAGSALSSTLDLEEGLNRACNVLTRRLADWCAVDLLEEHGHVERTSIVHRDPRALTSGVYLGRLPPVSEASHGPLARVLRGAGPLLLTEIPSPGRAPSPLDARQLDLFTRLGASSAIIAPLRARREVLGALTLVRTDAGRPFTEQDLPLVSDLVRGIALGVDSARLYQKTRHTAERLQRSLLPHLPHIEHLQLAARYAPSSTTAQVGGDWYDAFVLPSGDTVLVIGDVTGHDLQAAVAMSALRNMLRGIALDRQQPPGDVLRRLDLASHVLYRQATATCLYGLVKGPKNGPWQLHHASAGHLPPLLTTAEGDTRYLEEGAGLLIGMDPDLPRPTACDPLPAHSTLLLFTDGLIERRGESLDDSLSRLRQHTAALARAPLDVFCDELLIGLGAHSADDIALLAVRPVPP
ncbi:SpoIIE family protein phosphatase [Actinoallomurus rhizosphaericola]|uniref:SpoIIE family protein phosphatase n=1 Tax=Actinoallomurus rhizosphaericola TaxID=2952536 RepID=UPI0020926BB8|nr:SpoIIE family protein phosphatase [Actinoallomurus rhizosphaericola]MCO5995904.1 SpoIIE family protein phosphatase [Actinoallomurus rhizosphaericola]